MMKHLLPVLVLAGCGPSATPAADTASADPVDDGRVRHADWSLELRAPWITAPPDPNAPDTVVMARPQSDPVAMVFLHPLPPELSPPENQVQCEQAAGALAGGAPLIAATYGDDFLGGMTCYYKFADADGEHYGALIRGPSRSWRLECIYPTNDAEAIVTCDVVMKTFRFE